MPLSWLLFKHLQHAAKLEHRKPNMSRLALPSNTHNLSKPVMLPSVKGMLPLSWLLSKLLQHARQPILASRAAAAPTRHAQILQAREAAEHGGDGAAQLVGAQVPATRIPPSLSIAHPSRHGPRSHAARTVSPSP